MFGSDRCSVWLETRVGGPRAAELEVIHIGKQCDQSARLC